METVRMTQKAKREGGDAALINKAVELMQLIEAAEAEEAAQQTVGPKTVVSSPHVKKPVGIPYDEFRKRAEEILEQSSRSSFNPKDFYILKERRQTRLELAHRRAAEKCAALHLLEELILWPAGQTEENCDRKIVIGKLSRPLNQSESSLYKNFNCPHYERCVVFADEKGLRSFSCVLCPHFKFTGTIQVKPQSAALNPAWNADMEKMQEAARKRLARAEELKERAANAQTKTALSPAPAAIQSHGLLLVKAQRAQRILSETEKNKGELVLVERFRLRPEENQNIVIVISRLARALWSTEKQDYQKQNCEYFARCSKFADEKSSKAFTCVECPNRNSQGGGNGSK